MSVTVRFILGGVVGIIGVLGLIGAAEAERGELYYFGLAVFAAAVAYDFYLVKHTFDTAERIRAL